MWKECVSQMGYTIHFHEIESIHGNMGDNNARGVIKLDTHSLKYFL